MAPMGERGNAWGPRGGRGRCPGKWVCWLWTLLRGGEACLLSARAAVLCSSCKFLREWCWLTCLMWNSALPSNRVQVECLHTLTMSWASLGESHVAAEFLAVRRRCYAFRKLCILTQEHQLLLDSRNHVKFLPKCRHLEFTCAPGHAESEWPSALPQSQNPTTGRDWIIYFLACPPH